MCEYKVQSSIYLFIYLFVGAVYNLLPSALDKLF